ncbi:hypothetical protein KUTeg_017897 [Tegillarca granosa]|uniref:DDE-1 domain-containing protein n=1 Tax=Tegillarca granosa TaxID=220873 RepID=A0ABQ9EG89_TEGGR|nr:hypothetical protein KUTeg_017897 [Tegillarca granosa]
MFQTKEPRKGKYRLNYDAVDITKALVMVNEKGVSVERAARSCGVPVTTLKDRVRGRVGIDVLKSGPDPLFSLEEESQLFDNISTMTEIGYGYTRAETLNLASDYSVHLGHRDRQHPLILRWLYNFLQRWPDVRVQKPHSLEAVRAKCTSKETVNRYFEELEKILNKYGLKDKPERVFNIDEKGFSTDCKPPNIIAATSYKPQVVTTGKTKTVTVIGSGNAIGNQVPPYFIFPGQRMVSELLNGASVGVQGTVSETSWSNTNIFEMYLKEHLIKHLLAHDTNNKVLVLYDGHKSHVAMGIIDWARKENIVLFILPPHTSQILQPLDVSVFGPFEVAWRSACHSHLRDTGGNIITRYDVCKIACSVYTKTLTPSNIQSAFKKSGIYPFDPSIIPDTALAPALSFPVEIVPTAANVTTSTASDLTCPSSSNVNLCNHSNVNTKSSSDCHSTVSFFDKQGGMVLSNMKVRKARKTLSKVVGGRPITEDSVLDDIKKHYDGQKQKKGRKGTDTSKDSQVAGCSGNATVQQQKRKSSTADLKNNSSTTMRAKARRSDTQIFSHSSDESSDEEVKEEEKCCVCKRFSLPGIQWSIVFTKFLGSV